MMRLGVVAVLLTLGACTSIDIMYPAMKAGDVAYDRACVERVEALAMSKESQRTLGHTASVVGDLVFLPVGLIGHLATDMTVQSSNAEIRQMVEACRKK